jgi:anti-sigma B factor antagonist
VPESGEYPHQLAIEREDQDRAAVLRIRGTVDLQTSPDLRKALIDAARRTRHRLVVDLSAVDYMDSSGLATLVEAFQRAQQAGGMLRLAAPAQAITFVIRLGRLDRLFHIDPSVDDALAQLGDHPA